MIFNKYDGLNTLCKIPTIHVRAFVNAIISIFSCYEQNKNPLKSWTLRSMRQRWFKIFSSNVKFKSIASSS